MLTKHQLHVSRKQKHWKSATAVSWKSWLERAEHLPPPLPPPPHPLCWAFVLTLAQSLLPPLPALTSPSRTVTYIYRSQLSAQTVTPSTPSQHHTATPPPQPPRSTKTSAHARSCSTTGARVHQRVEPWAVFLGLKPTRSCRDRLSDVALEYNPVSLNDTGHRDTQNNKILFH